MIGYTTVGSNDLEKAKAFYEPLFEMMGAQKVFDAETFVSWIVSPDKPIFALAKPYDGKAATVGNGSMIALSAGSTEEVDKLHAKALSLGAQNEGDPGMRLGGYYCAYFRDMDGNKLNFFCMPEQSA